MKFLVVLPLLVASAMASGIIHSVEPIPQYTQEQNTATGEYGYSYSGGPSAKTEFRATDGTTTGTYSYIDAFGVLQTVSYIADEFGFRAAGSNIPSEGSVPLDAPDVAIAKAAHLAEHSRATHEALSRQKRGAIFPTLVAAPVVHTLPLATSSQSRFQIHNSARIIHHEPIIATHPLFFRKKRSLEYAAPLAVAAPLPASSAKIYGEFAEKPTLFSAPVAHVAAAPVVAAAPAVELRAAAPIVAAAPAAVTTTVTQHLPYATSSQSRFQIHKGAKIIEEVHQPIYAAAPAPIIETRAAIPAAPIVETRAAIPALPATIEHLPLSTSSQSRFQVHNGAKIIEEFHQPIYAAAAAAPVAFAEHFAPALPAAPIAPAFPGAPIAPAFPGAPIAPAYPGAPIAPALPSTEAVIAENDAISVESA